jgi:hypothetical protein
MFREKVPNSFEEIFISKTGKILWIPSSEEEIPTINPIPEILICTKRDLSIYFAETGVQKYLVRSELANYLYNKIKNNIYSEIYCPIIYREYVPGYIYIGNTMDKKESLDKDNIDDLYQLSNILSYSLMINGYFKRDVEEGSLYISDVIDLSPSGLLFTTNKKELNKELLLHADLKIRLTFKENTIEIGSRIIRKYNDQDNYYFAVKFLKINKKDFDFLFESLYGKKYSFEEETIWEGGFDSSL